METNQHATGEAKPVEVAPKLPHSALPGADWADAFVMTSRRRFASMRVLAQATIGSMPPWASRLLKLRNVIVRPFGLKRDGVADAPNRSARIGIFPIVEETADTIVLGLDDSHLDFRIVIERTPGEALGQVGDQLRVTTLVKRHNPFGRTYIAAITPFHKAIVAALMRQAG